MSKEYKRGVKDTLMTITFFSTAIAMNIYVLFNLI